MCQEIIRESLQHKIKNVAGFTEFLLDEILVLRNVQEMPVEEITKRIEHRSYKMQGYITEYQVLGKENFSMDEDLERFLYSYE